MEMVRRLYEENKERMITVSVKSNLQSLILNFHVNDSYYRLSGYLLLVSVKLDQSQGSKLLQDHKASQNY